MQLLFSPKPFRYNADAIPKSQYLLAKDFEY